MVNSANQGVPYEIHYGLVCFAIVNDEAIDIFHVLGKFSKTKAIISLCPAPSRLDSSPMGQNTRILPYFPSKNDTVNDENTAM